MAATLKREYRAGYSGCMITTEEQSGYFSAHPDVLGLLDEAINKVEFPAEPRRFSVAVEMERNLGPASLVEAPEININTPASFVRRPGRAGMTRVLKVAEKDLPQVRTVVVIGEPTDDPRAYKLVTAYIGVVAPPEPWADSNDPHPATEESMPFWSNHALVWQPAWGEVFTLCWQEVFYFARSIWISVETIQPPRLTHFELKPGCGNCGGSGHHMDARGCVKCTSCGFTTTEFAYGVYWPDAWECRPLSAPTT